MKLSDTLGIGDSLAYFRLAHSDYSGKGAADIRDNFFCMDILRPTGKSDLLDSQVLFWNTVVVREVDILGPQSQTIYKGSSKDEWYECAVAWEKFWRLVVAHWPHQFGNGYVSPQVTCVTHSKKQDWHTALREQKAVFKIPVSVFSWPLWLPK